MLRMEPQNPQNHRVVLGPTQTDADEAQSGGQTKNLQPNISHAQVPSKGFMSHNHAFDQVLLTRQEL